MSNSPLVTDTGLSPNYTKGRTYNGKTWGIDTVTIHCVVGQVTAKRGCELFQNPSRNASCNYVVGCDGSIGLCVEEENRSWCTGGELTVNGQTGKGNDFHAVTIEVASDTTHPYAVTDAAYDALIRLVADIAKRNGLGRLKWKADPSLVGKPEEQNMTVHRWFARKACPGQWLYERMGEIAERANAINFPAGGEKEEISVENNSNAPVATWAQGAWEKAATSVGADGNAVMDGTRPWDAVTRQEVAVILDRLGLLKGGAGR